MIVRAPGHLAAYRPSRILIAFAVVLALTGIATATSFILQLRSRTLELAEQEVRRVNLVLADQAARTIRSVDIVLQATASSFEDLRAHGQIDGKALHEFLAARIEGMSDIVRAHGIIDAQAITRYSSRDFPSNPVYTGDREYFALHRDHPEVGLFLSGPVRSRAGGEWALYLTRRINGPHGEFDGVVFALIEPKYFEDQFESLDLGDGGAIALFIDNGILVGRYPRAPEAIGRSFADGLVFRKLLAGGRERGSGRVPVGLFDQEARVISAQRLPGLSLTVAVSHTEDTILAEWRRQAWIIALSTSGGLAVLLLLVQALVRQLRRHERTAAALEEAGRSLEMAQRVAHLGSWTLHFPSMELSCSEEMHRILGLIPTSSVLPGDTAMKYLHPDDQPQLDRARLQLLAGKRIQHIEGRVVRPTGEVRWIEIEAEPIMDPDGKIVRVFGTMLDITERKLFETELQQSQRLEAVGKLTGGMAHDFNNLLAVISGNLELVEESLLGHEDLRTMLRTAIRATARGATLTQSLLAFSRQQPLSPATVDVRKLVEEMIDLFRRTVPENIEIELVSGAGLWTCEADPGQLQNALLNLVVNARDAMPDGGRLTIETGNARLDDDYAAAHAEVAPGQYVMLAVSDTGTGMPPDVAARAFEPFFTTKTVDKGTGLGLSMVYGFAKQSKGHAKIYSEVGHGTTVRIYLPRSVPTTDDALSRSTAENATSLGETILAVEDDPDVRTLVFALLRSLDYEVLVARTPQEALRLIRENPHIALLLTDVILPGGMNGRQLAEEAVRLLPHIKVLYMSGYTENAILHHGRLDPGVHLLQKPFSKRDLSLKIHTLLSHEMVR